ncbi:MAG: hypothetical protein DRJ35_00345 [Thermoprotei archaeon]|nr:MAG: hypothetical protein DRJ35_00345 [Thermoprotei archaeon]
MIDEIIFYIGFVEALVFILLFLAQPISSNAVIAAKLFEAYTLSETVNATALPGSFIVVYTTTPLSIKDGKIEATYAINITGHVDPTTCFKILGGRITGCGA